MRAPNVKPKIIMLGFVTKRKVITLTIMVPVIIIIQTRMLWKWAMYQYSSRLHILKILIQNKMFQLIDVWCVILEVKEPIGQIG